eukprot:5348207-Prymnesium_polylepis.1
MPVREHSESAAALAGRSRGDLVVKFPVALPPRPRRLAVVAGLPMPPVALITADESGGLPCRQLESLLSTTLLEHVLRHVQRAATGAAAQQEGAAGWRGPGHDGARSADGWLVAALEAAAAAHGSAIGSAVVEVEEEEEEFGPVMVRSEDTTPPRRDAEDPPVEGLPEAGAHLRAALARYRAPAAVRATASGVVASGTTGQRHRPALHGVCVRVGGLAPQPPSAVAAALMRTLSARLPQLAWRVVYL